MPTYEYKCGKCFFTFERFQGITDDPVKECPRCGSSVRRVISSSVGIILKGNGFYKTDYKDKPKEKDKKERTDKGPAPCGGAETCPCCN